MLKLFPALMRWSKSLYCIFERVVHKVRIDFGTADVEVAEGFLDQPQVGSGGIEVSRERVPQTVRRDVLLDSGFAEPVGKALGDLSAADPRSAR